MACRKPVVATRTNGPSDYVRDGVTGLLCEIRNSRDLADKLERLAADPALAKRMGQSGYELLQREFTEADYIRHYRAMLVSLGVLAQGALALGLFAATVGVAVATQFAVGATAVAAHAGDALARGYIDRAGRLGHAMLALLPPSVLGSVAHAIWSKRARERALTQAAASPTTSAMPDLVR